MLRSLAVLTLLFLSVFTYGQVRSYYGEYGNSSFYIERAGSEKEDLSESFYEPPFSPDTTVGPFKLFDAEGSKRHLGDSIMEHLETGPDHASHAKQPHIRVVSQERDELLTLIFHPGGVKNEFSEFKVERYRKDSFPIFKRIDVKEFKTGSGIELGMMDHQLTTIKGRPDTITQNGDTSVFHYRFDRDCAQGREICKKQKDFLDSYNMPAYRATYHFVDGELIRLRFGFPMP